MERTQTLVVGLLALSLLGIGGIPSISQAADETSSQSATTAPGSEAASKDGACCKSGDDTPLALAISPALLVLNLSPANRTGLAPGFP